jgi:hypothetical protein
VNAVRTYSSYAIVAILAMVAGALLFNLPSGVAGHEPRKSAPEVDLATNMHDQDNLNISVLGDSTGNDSTEWVAQWGMLLAAQGASVQVRTWDHAQADWSPDVVRFGAGERSITIWNGSVSGATPSYPLSFKTLMQPRKPDVTIVNYGHDHRQATAALATEMTNLLDSLKVRWGSSDASVVLTVQNPGQGSAAVTSAAQRHEVKRIARERELPVADIDHAFHNVGDLSRLMVNEKHPGPSGSMVWATTVNELFTRS